MPIPTLENDQKAGNEEDQVWADELARIKAPESLEGQGFDDEAAKEQAALKAALPEENDESTSQKQSFWGKLRKSARSKSATLSIVAILGGTGVAGLAPAALGGLPTMLSKVVGNHTDMSNRIMDKTGLSVVYKMFGQDRVCATATWKCKFGTISEARKAQWESRGVRVKAEKNVLGRYKVTALEFPTGTKVETLRQWHTLSQNDRVAASLLKRLPIRAGYENKKSMAGKAVAKVGANLYERFKSSKLKDKEARKAANAKIMNARTGATVGPDGKVTAESIKSKDKSESTTSKLKDRVKGVDKTLKMAGSVSIGVVLACMGYDIVRATQASMILMWNEELVKFALPFLQAGSQQIESGVNDQVWDAETAEYYGDRLTTPITQKDIDADPEDNITPNMLGKTAMDSKGIGAALNGDPVINENYSGWAPVNDVAGSKWIAGIQKMLGGGDVQSGKENIRTGCTVAGYTALLGLVQCATPQTLIKCIAFAGAYMTIANIWGEDIVKLVVKEISEPALKIITKANLSDSLVGPPLGDAIVSAAGIMGENMDRAGELAVATDTQEAAIGYRDLVNDEDYTQNKIAEIRDQAAKNQFDVSNQYSFAGQLAAQFSSVPQDGTLFSVFANMTHAVASIPVMAQASAISPKKGLYQPIEIYQSEEKFMGAVKNCNNPGKSDNKIACIGESGRSVPILLSPVKECVDEQIDGAQRDCLQEAYDYLANRKYVVENNGKNEEKPFLNEDESGAPNEVGKYSKDGLDFDNPMLMYMRHCGGDRVFPLGYTDQPSDSKNYDWYVGTNCTSGGTFNKTDLAWTSFYLNTCIAIWASEEDSDTCWSELAANTTVASSQWIIPLAGQCGDGFDSAGTRLGRNHKGVDISAGAGTALVAPTDVKVVAAGVSSDGTTGNMIAMEAVDGSGGFMFMHMQEPSPLKPGDTVIKKGTPVGKVGSTGNSSGPHLHMDVFPTGTNPAGYAGQIDPVKAFATNGVTISGCK